MARSSVPSPPARPADECPFRRPLPEGFDGCPTFIPVRYVPLDSRNQPLHPVIACRHMTVGGAEHHGSTFYCRCMVGDGAARAALAGHLPAARRRLMREVADALNELISEHWVELAEAKVGELAAGSGLSRERARFGVSNAAAGFQEAAGRLVRGRLRPQLWQLGLEPDALLRIVAAALEDYQRRGFASWVIPDDLLKGVPEDVAAFLRGRFTATADSGGESAAGEPQDSAVTA